MFLYLASAGSGGSFVEEFDNEILNPEFSLAVSRVSRMHAAAKQAERAFQTASTHLRHLSVNKYRLHQL